MTTDQIVFIGGGNMASCIIAGLIADGYEAKNICISEPNTSQRKFLSETYTVSTTTPDSINISNADIVVLAVKPQLMQSACEHLVTTNKISKHCLFLSIAAGIRETDLNNWLGGGRAVIRTMPNTPALVQSGASALWANDKVNQNQKNAAENILNSVGLTVWLPIESQMDAVTALSGSGPAYFFKFIETLADCGHKMGLPSEVSYLLSVQTAFGAAKMALESEENVSLLGKQVTSPGGTTERALKILENEGFVKIIEAALQGAKKRADELASQLGNQHNE